MNVTVAVATPSITLACDIASFPTVNVIVPPFIGFSSLIVAVAVIVVGVFITDISGTSIVVMVSIVLFSIVAGVGALIVSSPYSWLLVNLLFLIVTEVSSECMVLSCPPMSLVVMVLF